MTGERWEYETPHLTGETGRALEDDLIKIALFEASVDRTNNSVWTVDSAE
jgi:hypothetical protein